MFHGGYKVEMDCWSLIDGDDCGRVLMDLCLLSSSYKAFVKSLSATKEEVRCFQITLPLSPLLPYMVMDLSNVWMHDQLSKQDYVYKDMLEWLLSVEATLF
jgi:hypothetical protein